LRGASGGSVKYATVAGKTATLPFIGSQIAWVSTQGPTQGSASVKLDTGSPVTVNTHTTSAKPAETVDVVKAVSGTHKLVIAVLGTSGRPRIDVDAFAVLS
jgi:hypothetical protein